MFDDEGSEIEGNDVDSLLNVSKTIKSTLSLIFQSSVPFFPFYMLHHTNRNLLKGEQHEKDKAC